MSTSRGESFPVMSQDSSVCYMFVFAECAMYLRFPPLSPSARQVRRDLPATFSTKVQSRCRIEFQRSDWHMLIYHRLGCRDITCVSQSSNITCQSFKSQTPF